MKSLLNKKNPKGLVSWKSGFRCSPRHSLTPYPPEGPGRDSSKGITWLWWAPIGDSDRSVEEKQQKAAKAREIMQENYGNGKENIPLGWIFQENCQTVQNPQFWFCLQCLVIFFTKNANLPCHFFANYYLPFFVSAQWFAPKRGNAIRFPLICVIHPCMKIDHIASGWDRKMNLICKCQTRLRWGLLIFLTIWRKVHLIQSDRTNSNALPKLPKLCVSRSL